MKTLIVALFVIITDYKGNESLHLLSEHKSHLSCNVEKAKHQQTAQIAFYCSDKHKYISKK